EMGREPTPSAGIVDRQSVETGPGGGPIGFDAGKKVKGRKRHRVVDTPGSVLAALVTPASVPDPLAAPEILAQAKAKSARLQRVWADGRYQGPIVPRAAQALDLTVEIVSPLAGQKGFQVLPKRWIVETTRTHYPPNAFVDSRAVVSDHRDHRAAQSRGARRD